VRLLALEPPPDPKVTAADFKIRNDYLSI
jgi:hypothetical protein